MNQEETNKILNTAVPTGEFLEVIDNITLNEAKSLLQNLANYLYWDEKEGIYHEYNDYKRSDLRTALSLISKLVEE